MKTHRIDQMEQYIIENRTVTMNQLCEHFNVSINTVRQDVATLSSKGTIKKIYGGVTCAQKTPLQPFEERRLRNLDGKRTIARLAASFVDDFDIIYIDSGTTASLLLEYIDPAKHVTVITNSLIAVNTAMQYENLAVICLPGKLNRACCSFVSSVTVHALECYNIKKSFMSTTGLSRSGEVTDCTLQQQDIKSMAVSRCEQNYLLMDVGKFGRSSLISYTDISQMEAIITDAEPPSEMQELCQKKNVRISPAAVRLPASSKS